MVKKGTVPNRFSGTITVPSDKSLTHRAVLFAALSEGTSVIHQPLQAEDCLSTLSCVEQLGCEIERHPDQWVIKGKGLLSFKEPKEPLDCGNSGTTMRLLSGILAAQPFRSTLTGDQSLQNRPMDRVAKPLTEMGAKFEMRDNRFAPFTITGTKSIKPIRWTNPVASAQVKSAVLLAGLHATGETIYTEPSLSRDHTERMMASMGVSFMRNGLNIHLNGPARLMAQNWTIPGDFSSAAFFLIAGLLINNSKIRISNVNLNPTRTGLLTVCKAMGAKFSVEEMERDGDKVGTISVNTQQKLKAIHVQAKDIPQMIDEIPILAVAASQAEGETVLEGLEELRIKETDRIMAIAENMKKLGANVRVDSSSLIINGPTPLKGATVDSYEDHRIAMSMGIAGLISDGPVLINNPECVKISYPEFWSVLKKLSE